MITFAKKNSLFRAYIVYFVHSQYFLNTTITMGEGNAYWLLSTNRHTRYTIHEHLQTKCADCYDFSLSCLPVTQSVLLFGSKGLQFNAISIRFRLAVFVFALCGFSSEFNSIFCQRRNSPMFSKRKNCDENECWSKRTKQKKKNASKCVNNSKCIQINISSQGSKKMRKEKDGKSMRFSHFYCWSWI